MTARNAKTTPATWLAALPSERRVEIEAVYRAVRAKMPRGLAEGIQWGMISWYVPTSVLPETYNGQPLCYAALAMSKNYCTLHLMGPYGHAPLRRRLEEGFRDAGRKLDMGKACIHFRKADDLALDVIGEVVAAIPMERYVAIYHESRKHTAKSAAAARTLR